MHPVAIGRDECFVDSRISVNESSVWAALPSTSGLQAAEAARSARRPIPTPEAGADYNSLHSWSRDDRQHQSVAESFVTSAFDLSVPSFHAQSPALVKAEIAAAGSASRRPNLPCTFTLRGKHQSRPASHGRSKGKSITSDESSFTGVVPGQRPLVPSLRILIRSKGRDAGMGYSPRLRMMGDVAGNAAKTFEDAENRCQNTEVPASITPELKMSNDIAARAESPAIVNISNNDSDEATAPDRRVAAPCFAHTSTGLRGSGACNCSCVERTCKTQSPAFCGDVEYDRGNPPEIAGERNATIAGGKMRHPQSLGRGNPYRPMQHRLCGRLWTGTTAPPNTNRGRTNDAAEKSSKNSTKTSLRRKRVLFLVSGQGQCPGGQQQRHRQQQQPSTAFADSQYMCGQLQTSSGRRSKSAGRGYYCHRYTRNGSPARLSIFKTVPGAPRSAAAATIVQGSGTLKERATLKAPRTDGNHDDATESASSVFRRWNWNEGKKSGTSAKDSARGRIVHDGGNYGSDNDLGTVKATAGGEGRIDGGSGERAVLHVRVPRAPPTDMLVLRWAPAPAPSPNHKQEW